MVHLFQMGKLMDDNVVNDRLRHHQELPVEVEIAFPGAATPTSLRSSYTQPAGSASTANMPITGLSVRSATGRSKSVTFSALFTPEKHIDNKDTKM